MNAAFRTLLALTGLAGALLAGTAQAQSTDAEVRKIDRVQGKITLRHGEIKNLDMPPMTMVFHVADPKMLDGLAEGAKVRFDAEKINGQYTVVRLVPAPRPGPDGPTWPGDASRTRRPACAAHGYDARPRPIAIPPETPPCPAPSPR